MFSFVLLSYFCQTINVNTLLFPVIRLKMAALDEEDLLDEENFQESGFLSFSSDVQAAIDEVHEFSIR